MQANWIHPGLVVLAAVGLLAAWIARRGVLRSRRRRFIAGYRFPAALRAKVGARYPELSFAQIDRIHEGLRSFFRACLEAQSGRRLARQLGMPSKAVDDAWHEFILMTEAYSDFCRRAFGRYLHHAPEGQMRASMRDALANTLHQVRKEASIPGVAAAGAAVPLLFMLDRELGIPGGYTYDEAALAAIDDRRKHLAAQGAGDSGAGVDGGCGAHTGSACDSSAASCDGGAGAASCGGGSGCGGGGGCGS